MSKQIFPNGTGSMAAIHLSPAPDVVWWAVYIISPVDGLIHELELFDAKSINYTENVLNIGPRPLPGGPIAAVSWKQSDEASTSMCGQRT